MELNKKWSKKSVNEKYELQKYVKLNKKLLLRLKRF